MSSSPIIAENYHLKWDSHLTNLNLSLTSLFRTEKFADVMLLSSHPDCVGGPAIPAHKIILSSCSHFFSTIFTNQLAHNGLMYIMLPPELSYRCIKILVQYMYSGESTVSNDILNEVLSGGEILKIRGLCKSRSRQIIQRSYTPTGGNNIGKSPLHQSPIASLPKDSPVVIKLPNKQPVHKLTTCAAPPSIIEKGLISIKKDIAIDPEGVTSNSDLLQTPCKNCKQNCCKICLPPPSNCNIKEHLSNETTIPHHDSTKSSVTSHISNLTQINCEPSTSGMSSSKRKIIEASVKNNTETDSVGTRNDDITSKKKSIESEKLHNLLITQENSIKQEKDLIETIKQEPMEWHQSNSENSSSSSHLAVKPPAPLLENIKIENLDEASVICDGEQVTEKFEIIEIDDGNESDNYQPLECEICNETFALPKDWVQHIETHMEGAKVDIPKKKQKLTKKNTKDNEADKDYIVALKCDLCSTFFNSPGDWVRHIENQHTEIELAAINHKQVGRPKNDNIKKKFDSYLNKVCEICGESFPTYAKMIIHYRTHITKKT